MFRRAAACLLTLIVAGAAAPAARPGSGLLHHNRQEPLRPRRDERPLSLVRQMPNVNPTSFASPEAYLEAVRYKTLDSTFSYITSRAANDAFYSDSQFIGFGLSTSLNGIEMRVTQVFPDSPALEAGLSRGDRIVEIGGRTGGGADRERRDRLRLRPVRHRRRDEHRVHDQAGARRERAHGQAAGDDSDRVADAGLQRGRAAGRLHLLSQLRQAVVRGARRGLRRARRPPESTSSCSISATTAAGW